MSVCINRKPGLITMRPMCSEKMKPCPWYRAAWCVPADLIRFVCGKICRFLLGLEEKQ